MKFYNALWVLSVMAGSLLFLGGCAAKEEKAARFIVPAPPEEPRIAHIASYKGQSDFQKTSALDSFLGEMGSSSKDLVKPYGVAANKGKIYVTDTALGAVFVMDTVKNNVTFLGMNASGKLALPVGIAFDAKDNVYISDSKLKRVYGYDENGSAIKVFGKKDEFMRPTGIAIDKETGILYVVDTLAHTIHRFSLASGELIGTIGKRGVDDGTFNYPTNIAIDRRNSNIIVGDTQNFRIQIFDKNGNFLGKFGKIGDKPGMFARPKGVAVDSEGHIYAADAAFQNIQIFNDQGQLLLYFGNAGKGPGEFDLPSGLYFDEDDRLYTVETFSPRVQVFQYLSQKWKKEHPNEYKQIMEMK